MSIITELKYLNFEPVNEEWSEYKLEDGSIIKLKFVLIKILKENDSFALNSSNIIGVYPSQDLIATPSHEVYSPQELEQSIDIKDVNFEVIKEIGSVYKLEDGSELSVKPVLVLVSRSSKHDQHGEPIYLVQSQQIIKKV